VWNDYISVAELGIQYPGMFNSNVTCVQACLDCTRVELCISYHVSVALINTVKSHVLKYPRFF
jgi:hypothetical protein